MKEKEAATTEAKSSVCQRYRIRARGQFEASCAKGQESQGFRAVSYRRWPFTRYGEFDAAFLRDRASSSHPAGNGQSRLPPRFPRTAELRAAPERDTMIAGIVDALLTAARLIPSSESPLGWNGTAPE
jgi:hypothetical protein